MPSDHNTCQPVSPTFTRLRTLGKATSLYSTHSAKSLCVSEVPRFHSQLGGFQELFPALAQESTQVACLNGTSPNTGQNTNPATINTSPHHLKSVGVETAAFIYRRREHTRKPCLKETKNVRMLRAACSQLLLSDFALLPNKLTPPLFPACTIP